MTMVISIFPANGSAQINCTLIAGQFFLLAIFRADNASINGFSPVAVFSSTDPPRLDLDPAFYSVNRQSSGFTNVFTVNIKRVRCIDESMYRCRAAVPNAVLTAEGNSKIFLPPEYQKVEALVPSPITVGQTVTLVCSSNEFRSTNTTPIWQLQRPLDTQFSDFVPIRFNGELQTRENLTGSSDIGDCVSRSNNVVVMSFGSQSNGDILRCQSQSTGTVSRPASLVIV
ncbi:hypothetical protein Btru_029570 [Bulinus truncatus]|nr:hypothetical protein Btru_029570 [Bulinus truncatus]